MVTHGFYKSQKELKDIAEPMVSLLNGSNDIYTSDEVAIGANQRYIYSDENQVIMIGKQVVCEILLKIS
jgi:hypothetical protein